MRARPTYRPNGQRTTIARAVSFAVPVAIAPTTTSLAFVLPSAVPVGESTPPSATPVGSPGALGVGSPELVVAVVAILAALGYLAIRGSGRAGSGRRWAFGTADRNDEGFAPGGESGADGPQVGPLADEEYVVRKLRVHDGRMKQSELVRATGWSKAKVSRVLSRVEAAGRIRKDKRGRENVIVLEDD